MKVRNCLTCIYFAKKMTYEYSKTGNIVNVFHIMNCNKLNIDFQMKNSKEKDTNDINNINDTKRTERTKDIEELQFISSKCHNAKYYQKVKKINPYKVICIDV